jgi:hypothetical protein
MTNSNPLAKYFRKATVYITLPTKGIFNPELDMSALGDIGVMPMTALDEIALRNPEALLNGEAMIDVIKSCVPSIPDPRKLCNIDIEALYLAIKYATDGKDIELQHKCAECGETNNFSVDIDYILNRLPSYDTIPVVEHEDIKIYIMPPTIGAYTKKSLIDLEQKRIVKDINETIKNGEAKEEESAKRFYKSYLAIAQHNIDMLVDCIHHIELPDQEIYDKTVISEFLNNVDSSLVDKINKEAKALTRKPKEMTHMDITCPNCDTKSEKVLEVNPVNFSTAG